MYSQRPDSHAQSHGGDRLQRRVLEGATRESGGSRESRESHGISCAENAERESPPAFSGLALPAAAAIAIPSLHPKIPFTLSQEEGVNVWAKLAIRMLENNMISPEETSRANIKTISKIVMSGMQRWLDSHTAKLKHINFGFFIANQPDQIGTGSGSNIDEEFESVIERKGTPVLFASQHDDGNHLFLEDAITALESFKPGFGQIVLSLLDRSFGRTLQALTPTVMLEIAMNHYWMGEEDETTYVEEYLQEGECADDYNIFTRAEFDHAFPSWVVTPHSLLDETDLAAIAVTGNTQAANVAWLLLLLGDCITQDVELPMGYCNEWHYRLAACCILRWNERDATFRILDDFEQYAAESGEGYPDLHGVTLLDLETVDAFSQWKTKMEQGFKMLSLMDELLDLIGREPEKPKE